MAFLGRHGPEGKARHFLAGRARMARLGVSWQAWHGGRGRACLGVAFLGRRGMEGAAGLVWAWHFLAGVAWLVWAGRFWAGMEI